MFSHVTIGCRDLEKASAFYDAILLPLGLIRRKVEPDGGPLSACWVSSQHALPLFYVYMPFDTKPAKAGNGNMVAFNAPSSKEVDEAYIAGILAGGCDEGKPDQRPRYGNGYYGAYLRDPDGNKIHIVYRGDKLVK